MGIPFKSEKQRRYLWKHNPKLASKWSRIYGSKTTKGGILVVERKGVPRRDGSGRGIGANRGRGGCSPLQRKNRRRFWSEE